MNNRSAGEVLRARRAALSHTEGHIITQEEMAARAGYALSQRGISRLEAGTSSLSELTTPRAAALARALRWTLWQLQQYTNIDLGVLPEGATPVPFPVGHVRERYSGALAV